MLIDHENVVTLALVFAGALACAVHAFPGAAAAERPRAVSAALEAAPGTLVRWSVPGTTRCRMGARAWPPLGETCYFPIDLEQRPGVVTVARQGKGRHETARIIVGPRSYGTQEIELPDIPQANPSPADLKRNERERVLLGKVFHRREQPAKFSLPLGKPANALPEGKSFGVDRIFNGKRATQPHTGSDYPLPAGTPVLAAADGTVVLAQELFYPGNAVFIDHGDGLITMYFHLSDINVQAGQELSKGDRVGQVGSTGRSTGPHLFFGVRWHNARIDPRSVLEDPAKLPAL
jgi:murein DD-endopeptidase MepM/ murein hydrolase activator NlpD